MTANRVIVFLAGCLFFRRFGMWLRRKLLPAPAATVIDEVTVAGTAPTAADLRWHRRAVDLAFDALPNIRKSAEKWTGSIAALTGLATAIAVVKGREDISDLDRAWQIVVGVILGLAFYAALRAIVLSALAAQGTPEPFEPTGTAVRAWFEREAAEARDLLAYSRVLTVLAAVLLAFAVGTTWFGPEKEPAPEDAVYYAGSESNTACGTLSSAEGEFITIESGGQKTPFRLDELLRLEKVDGC